MRVRPTTAIFALILVIPLLKASELLNHIEYHLFGGVEGAIISGEWQLVAFNIAVFMAFLIPLSYRRKIYWGEYGLVTAFFVSLFIEMYGIPLTVYLAYVLLMPETPKPDIVYSYPLMGVNLDLTFPMAYGVFLMALGAALIIIGWVTLYTNRKRGLVTTGIYSLSRHPQYAGFILVISGWWLGWPTLLTTIFAPVLVWKYITVCKSEEKEVGLDADYKKYADRTPMLF